MSQPKPSSISATTHQTSHQNTSIKKSTNQQRSSRLDNYASWFYSKQKTQSLVKSLQTQNLLLKQTILQLQKQNTELLVYKQKVESTDSLSKNQPKYPRAKDNTKERLYQTSKKNTAASGSQTQVGSLYKGKQVKTARNSSQRIQGLLGDELIYQYQSNLKNSSKRFQYLTDLSTFALEKSSFQPKHNQRNLVSTEKTVGKTFTQELIAPLKHLSSLKQPKQINQLNIEAMQNQLNQMRTIQAHLLDRIQERDQIIEQLNNLIPSK